MDTSAVVALAAAHSSAVNALLGQGSVSTRSAHAAKMIGLGLEGGLGGGGGGTKGDRSNAWQMLTAGDTPSHPPMIDRLFPLLSFHPSPPSPTDPPPPLPPLTLLSPSPPFPSLSSHLHSDGDLSHCVEPQHPRLRG